MHIFVTFKMIIILLAYSFKIRTTHNPVTTMHTGGILRFVHHAPLFVPLFLLSSLPLSQMELQDDGVMLGLDSSLGKDIVGIINNVFQAPWGGSHTCQKDENALECSLCQSSILCYQLGCELLERLTPREEIRLVVRHAA